MPPAISLPSVFGAAELNTSISTEPLASLVTASESTSNVVISTLTPYLSSNAATVSGLT